MKPCTGCAHLVKVFNESLCSAMDPTDYRYVMNPYTNRRERVPLGLRPTVEAMRAPGGACGPDATLYTLVWWRRWLHWAG